MNFFSSDCPNPSDLVPGLTTSQTDNQLNRRIWAVTHLPEQQKLVMYNYYSHIHKYFVYIYVNLCIVVLFVCV